MAPICAELDLDAIVAAVEACPGVSAVATVPGAPAAGTEPGPTDTPAPPAVEGGAGAISYNEHTIDISVIAFYGLRLAVVVDQVEAAVRPLIGTRRLTVTVDDLDTRTATNDSHEPW